MFTFIYTVLLLSWSLNLNHSAVSPFQNGDHLILFATESVYRRLRANEMFKIYKIMHINWNKYSNTK